MEGQKTEFLKADSFQSVTACEWKNVTAKKHGTGNEKMMEKAMGKLSTEMVNEVQTFQKQDKTVVSIHRRRNRWICGHK